MIKLLFVVTTSVNIGDLSFCIEWVNELGREKYQHAFILDRSLRRFVHNEDRVFLFDPDLPVKETILEAVSAFKTDVVIFASNSYWNIQGQAGAERGKWDDEILNLDIPILSFDPLEGLTELYVHLWNVRIQYPPVPDKVWALRDSLNTSSAPNIRHFRILRRFESITDDRKRETLKRIGVDSNKKTVFFPIAENCYYDCRKVFYDYYSHLALLFHKCGGTDLQFLLLTPETIHELEECENVIQIGHQPYDIFLDILKSSDAYLTDCGVASSWLHAMSSSIPSVLLCNSYDSLENVPESYKSRISPHANNISGKTSFIYDNLYPFRVLPYGMVDLFEHFEKAYNFKGCYMKAEVLEISNFSGTIESLLFNEQTRQTIMGKCNELKSLYMKLRSPASIIEEVLS